MHGLSIRSKTKMKWKTPIMNRKMALLSVVKYIKYDYYCRRIVVFMLLNLMITGLFHILDVKSHGYSNFNITSFIFLSISLIFLMALITRILLMVYTVCFGVAVEAKVIMLVLFGSVFYEYDKAIEIINELKSHGGIESIRIKAISIEYCISEIYLKKTCWIHNQTYFDIQALLNDTIVVYTPKKCLKKFVVFKDLI